MKLHSILFVIALLAAASLGAQQQQFVTIEQVDGVTNFAHVETTVACGGAINPAAIADIRKMGFVSIFNLQEDSEPGAKVEAEAQAAKAAGMKFFTSPSTGKPRRRGRG
jgi:hypothetical protein